MKSSGYTLDLYCDNDNCPDKYKFGSKANFTEYTGEKGSTCRAKARKDGWYLAKNNEKDLCPKCNKNHKLRG
jgi:hypothetical protein